MLDRYIRDSLHNASKDCTDTDLSNSDTVGTRNLAQLYGSGIVVGVVSSLMAFHAVPYDVALRMLYQFVKNDNFDLRCLPDCWQADFAQAEIDIENRVSFRAIP